MADLGANVGLSVWYRLRRLPQCRVIALGPHPRRTTPSDEGTASTLTDAAERGLPVEVADIFALLAGRRVDLPKLDVEGGEYELLEDPRFAVLVPPALLLERDALRQNRRKR